MITDPQRKRRNDPGDPDICNVYFYHEMYTQPEKVSEIAASCRTAKIGCVECKKIMAQSLINGLEPIRKKREKLANEMDKVKEIMAVGNQKAKAIAEKTMEEVRQAIKMGPANH